MRKEKLTNGKAVARVYVGPNIHLNEIKKIRQRLKTVFKLNGIVRKYKV